jgi:hypothetical protein
LHHAGYFDVGVELLRELQITPAAGLQIALMRRSIHRRDVKTLELTGLAEFLPDLITDTKQTILFIRTRPIDLARKTGVDHLEIEYREPRWFGRLRWRRSQQHEKQQDSECSHNCDPQSSAPM